MATDGRNFGSLFLSPWKKKNICPVQGGCGRVLLAESVKTTHRSNSICACPSAGPTFNEHKRKRGEPQHTTGASCLLFSSLLLDSRCAASPFISQPNSYPVPSVRPSDPFGIGKRMGAWKRGGTPSWSDTPDPVYNSSPFFILSTHHHQPLI